MHKEGYSFFHRDLSWLLFNDRVLDEARRDTVPLMERIRFLAIYSSNLDEFYRVRMPALNALAKLSQGREARESACAWLTKINKTVMRAAKELSGGLSKNKFCWH